MKYNVVSYIFRGFSSTLRSPDISGRRTGVISPALPYFDARLRSSATTKGEKAGGKIISGSKQ